MLPSRISHFRFGAHNENMVQMTMRIQGLGLYYDPDLTLVVFAPRVMHTSFMWVGYGVPSQF